jgi:hypothetical protein
VRDGLRRHARRRSDAEFDKLQAIVWVHAAGGDGVEDVRVLARDAGLKRPPAGAWIPDESPALAARGALNAAVVRRAVTGLAADTATLDRDATTLVSHTRNARPLTAQLGAPLTAAELITTRRHLRPLHDPPHHPGGCESFERFGRWSGAAPTWDAGFDEFPSGLLQLTQAGASPFLDRSWGHHLDPGRTGQYSA